MEPRKHIEDREEQILAPYAMKSRLSRGRRYPEEEHSFRSRYQRDRDRIVHSSAFRKLEYKTQVFVNHEGDNFRTRLTHTMEVSQIARSVARNLSVNEDLTEAIALSHDIGHTPFGHAGEDALNEALDLYRHQVQALLQLTPAAAEIEKLKKRKTEIGDLHFEHNAHGLRIVEKLEMKYPDFPGLNLTHELRDSMAKHSSKNNRPLCDEYEMEKQPLLEAQVVDIADGIAYDNHDIEDSIDMGIMRDEDFVELELWKRALHFLDSQYRSLDRRLRSLLAIKFIINLEVTDLITHTLGTLQENKIQSVEDVRSFDSWLVGFSPPVQALRQELQSFMFNRVYRHYKVARMARKARRFICELFAEFSSPNGEDMLPKKYRDWVQEVGVIGICDYIASMTDRQAQDEYKKLFHPFERV